MRIRSRSRALCVLRAIRFGEARASREVPLTRSPRAACLPACDPLSGIYRAPPRRIILALFSITASEERGRREVALALRGVRNLGVRGWGMARNSSASCLFSGIGGVSLPFSHRTSLALLSFDIDSARWMKFIEEEGSERAIGKRTERKEEGRIEHITHRGRQNVDADGSCPEPLGTIPI